mmetsp:Transcript_23503/g.48797  ORF Transcript_23503/g.48797 Transcript_23503/m.48797 type:complete len:140 (-) Transcript_23503:168-587(-)|eukprot:CAMPEP_0172449186 /NCGR_PEP_ID=MMETSP1065-20121228/7955_1 /TAXON_ID=265537 /ORGANISM="Amphiprora paludosa, Strain CCMP125" /LENGTH=139 /DNA_ID=CAMNT_0013200803 /DNA_START=1491 /DNA_END=1910 /DNA_ORIENTATION=+
MSENIAKGMILTGAGYLSCMVGSSLLSVVLGYRQVESKYYEERRQHITYKVVPVFCLTLVGGLGANFFVNPSLYAAVGEFLIGFGTVYNNAVNVAAPYQKLYSGQHENVDSEELVKKIHRGHWIDITGFAALIISQFVF